MPKDHSVPPSNKPPEPPGKGPPDDHPPPGPPTVNLIFVIEGVDWLETAAINEDLAAPRNRALSESKHTGRPFDDWKIVDPSGSGDFLDPSKKVASFHFKDDTKLELILADGGGG